MDVQAGQLMGNCVLRRKLADGGMGSVWVAWHEGLSREVAVKVLTKSSFETVEQRRRFSLEARCAARIRSPYVPEIFEHGISEDGAPFLVMTLLDGVDLGSYLKAHGRMALRDVARLLDHVGHALSAAHEVGFVHRDVKPQNIILSRGPGADLEARLIDFGIAKSTHPTSSQMVTHPGTIVGTPNYMSPEQIAGKGPVDERADVWSLGVVAYVCLTGSLPFLGESFRQLCLAIYAGVFVPPSEHRPDLPPSLDAWFIKALSGDRRDRFPTVAAMTQAFLVAMTGAPRESRISAGKETSRGSSRPATPCVLEPRQTARRGWRDTSIAFALGGAVLGALGSALAALILGGASPARTVVEAPRSAAAAMSPAAECSDGTTPTSGQCNVVDAGPLGAAEIYR
jgi:eukaryotic-like serine/threonine-protein kinase